MEITAGETHEGKYYHGYKFIESCVKLLLGVVCLNMQSDAMNFLWAFFIFCNCWLWFLKYG
jgi:hypothetical protein